MRECSVLFVCLGNICRSPTAHGVFEALVKARGFEQWLRTDSAGTAAYHIGNAPDPRSVAAAAGRGYDLSQLRARQALSQDFSSFDYIVAMDESNLENLQQIAPSNHKAELKLFLDYAPQLNCREVPDPYYGGEDGFDKVLDLVEVASEALLDEIQRKYRS